MSEVRKEDPAIHATIDVVCGMTVTLRLLRTGWAA